MEQELGFITLVMLAAILQVIAAIGVRFSTGLAGLIASIMLTLYGFGANVFVYTILPDQGTTALMMAAYVSHSAAFLIGLLISTRPRTERRTPSAPSIPNSQGSTNA